jgi:hypothetical protein
MSEPEPNVPMLQAELDRLSLEQALIDVEISTARVSDLTQRLLEAHRELARVRAELFDLQQRHDCLRRDHFGQQTSRAFKTAEKVWALRRAIGV